VPTAGGRGKNIFLTTRCQLRRWFEFNLHHQSEALIAVCATMDELCRHNEALQTHVQQIHQENVFRGHSNKELGDS
jgi:hypothetical protein